MLFRSGRYRQILAPGVSMGIWACTDRPVTRKAIISRMVFMVAPMIWPAGDDIPSMLQYEPAANGT